MIPRLELLEPRDALSSWNVVQIVGTAPADCPLWLSGQFFLSQFNAGLRYEPDTIYAFVGPGSTYADTTSREVVPVLGGGRAPIVEAPNEQILLGGLPWEEGCFTQGWLFFDPPDFMFPDGIPSASEMPPGPMPVSTILAAPDFLLADVLIAQGDPYWWI